MSKAGVAKPDALQADYEEHMARAREGFFLDNALDIASAAAKGNLPALSDTKTITVHENCNRKHNVWFRMPPALFGIIFVVFGFALAIGACVVDVNSESGYAFFFALFGVLMIPTGVIIAALKS